MTAQAAAALGVVPDADIPPQPVGDGFDVSDDDEDEQSADDVVEITPRTPGRGQKRKRGVEPFVPRLDKGNVIDLAWVNKVSQGTLGVKDGLAN
jgi:hypothetical protein